MAQNRRDLVAVIRENLLLRLLVAGVVLLIAGGLILFATALPRPWQDLLNGIGVALFVSALVGLIYDLWIRTAAREEVLELVRGRDDEVRKAIREEMLGVMNLREQLTRGGILEFAKFSDIQWVPFLALGGDIDVFVSYAQSWAGTHAPQFVAAASHAEPVRPIRVHVLDPDGPAALLEVYAGAFEMDLQTLRQRIHGAIQIWEQAVAADGTRVPLTISYIRVMLPVTFYRSGDYMWVAPNVAQRRGRVGPRLVSFLCKRTGADDGFWDWIMSDVGACREQGLIVTRPAPQPAQLQE